MTVPFTFANQNNPIPLSELDANFASVGITDNIEYTAPVTNAVSETLTQKLSQYISVMDFIPSNVNPATTDVSGYIQEAINYAQSIAQPIGGVTVLIPSGQYLISSSLNVSNPINIIGAGSTSTALIATSSLATPMIMWGIVNTVPRPGYAVVIEKLGLYGDATTSSLAHGIQLWASHTNIKDCIISGFRGTAIEASDSWSNVVSHCWISGNRSNGITLQKASNIFVVENSYILNSGANGILVTAGNKVVLQNNDLEGNSQNGIAIIADGSTAMRSVSVINNYMENNNTSVGSYYSVYIDRNGNEITNIEVSYNYFETVNELAGIGSLGVNSGIFQNNQCTSKPVWSPLGFESSNIFTINNNPSTTDNVNNAVYSPNLYGNSTEGMVVNGRLSRFAVNTQEGTTINTLWSVQGRYSASPFPTFNIGTTTQSYGSAAPTSGTYTLGSIVWNTNPTAGGNVGWICTTAGTPGTWKTFGAISS